MSVALDSDRAGLATPSTAPKDAIAGLARDRPIFATITPVADVGDLTGPIEPVPPADPVVAGPSSPPGQSAPAFDLPSGFESVSPDASPAVSSTPPPAADAPAAEPAQHSRIEVVEGSALVPERSTPKVPSNPTPNANSAASGDRRQVAMIDRGTSLDGSDRRSSGIRGDLRPDAGLTRSSSAEAGQSIADIMQSTDGIQFRVVAIINDTPSGHVSILIPDADQDHPEVVANRMAVKVGDVLQLLRARMDPTMFAEMSSSKHVNDYVTFGAMRSHGIAVSFDRHDRLVLKAI